MKKSLRNKVLQNSSRLITCELNGEDWYSADGHFATAYAIFDGYKVKKSQKVISPAKKPSLTSILNHSEYALAEFETRKDDYIILSSTADDMTFMVDASYYDFLKSLYPNALPYTAINGHWTTPVELHDDGLLVAVISPCRQ